VVRRLASASELSFSLDVGEGGVGQVDVRDVSGGVGALRVHDDGSGEESCAGGLTLDDASAVTVSDCFGSDEGDVQVSFNVVSDSPSNCGRTFINQPTIHGELLSFGEVEAYRFLFAAGEVLILTPEPTAYTPEDIRIRVFDPSGRRVDDGDECGEVRISGNQVGFFTALVSLCSRPNPIAYDIRKTIRAGVESPELLPCGRTAVRPLSDGIDRFSAVVLPDSAAVVDLTEVHGSFNGFRIEPVVAGQPACGYTRHFTGAAAIGISDCDGSGLGQYGISLNVVSDTPDNCGIALRCGEVRADSLSTPGETDSFRLELTGAATFTLQADGFRGERLRLRAYEADGSPVASGDTCEGRLQLTPVDARSYTVLVSACDGPHTGAYTLAWLPTAPCASALAQVERAYLALETSVIEVLDVATNRLSSSIPVGNFQAGARLAHMESPSSFGFIYAAAEGAPAVSINTAANQVVGALPFGAPGFAVDPAGAFLYVPFAGQVAVIDIARSATLYGIPTETNTNVTLIRVSSDGRLLYVLAGPPVSRRIEVIDLRLRAVVGTILDPQFFRAVDMRLSPDGRTLYVITRDGEIVVVDPLRRLVLRTLSNVGRISSLAFSPVAPLAYLLQYDQEPPLSTTTSLIELNTINHSVVRSTPLRPAFGSHVAVSSSGKRILVAGASFDGETTSHEVDVLDGDTHQLLGRTPLDAAVVDLLAGSPPLGLCSGDSELQTKVTVGELMTSVNFALDGCPGDVVGAME
jgi:DNA-binding beta-propeller fold protein YncE